MPTADTRQQSSDTRFQGQQTSSSREGALSNTLAEFQARYMPGQQHTGHPADDDENDSAPPKQLYSHQPQNPVVNEHMQHYQPDSGQNYWPYRATDMGPVAEQYRPSQYTASGGDFREQFEQMKASYKPEVNERAQATGTSDAPLEFDSNSIKNYIKEQEEFLKRLDDQKKKLREKIFEEEEKFVMSSNKKQSPEQKKSAAQQKYSKEEEEEEPMYGRERKERPLPEDSADSEQLIQLKKRADDLLNKFMNPMSFSPNKDSAKYSSNYGRSDPRGDESLGSANPTLRKSPIKQTGTSYPDQFSTKRGRTPEKSAQKTVTFYGIDSPSELDYSVSDHERVTCKCIRVALIKTLYLE